MRVFIVLATFNPSEVFFLQQIDSIKKQVFRDWHCLVVDDDSALEKKDFIVKTVENDQRFTFVGSDSNVGVFHNFEKGFKLARELGADIIFPCDQDDIWKNHKIDNMLLKLKSSGALLVYSDARIINELNGLVSQSLFRFENRVCGEIVLDQLLLRNVVTGCCSVFDVRLLDYVLPFPIQNPVIFHHDLWLALFAAGFGRIVYLPSQLIDYRLHSSNVIGPLVNRNSCSIKSKIIGAYHYYALIRYIKSCFNSQPLVIKKITLSSMFHGSLRDYRSLIFFYTYFFGALISILKRKSFNV